MMFIIAKRDSDIPHFVDESHFGPTLAPKFQRRGFVYHGRPNIAQAPGGISKHWMDIDSTR